jgi:glycosyltransferase involved in cell wall biosynthesis
MHIGMIYGEASPFPPDIRLEKEIKALCEAGHRVTVLAQRIPSTASSTEDLIDKCASVRRISIPRGGFITRQVWHFTLVQRNWISALYNFTNEYCPDALHVHDLGLLPTTLKVSSSFNLPVVADLHENMPAALRAYRSNLPILSKLTNAVFYNYHLWRWKEHQALQKCTKIIVVAPEAAERLYKYKIPKEKIVIVSNTEDQNTFKIESEVADKELKRNYKNDWVALYAGGIAPHRGIDTVLKAMPIIKENIPNFKLLIVGARNNDRQQINTWAKGIDVESNLEILDWQPFEKIKSYIMASEVCLIPHNDFEHTHTTVPHKLFQYMLCKKPILVSSCKPLARIVNETKAGRIFKANNSVDFAQKIIEIYNNLDLSAKMGRNGFDAAKNSYSWRNDARRLIQMYFGLERHMP